MNKYILRSLILLFTLVISCSSDDDNPASVTPPSVLVNEVTVDIDGVSKTFDDIEVSTDEANDRIDVYATNSANPDELLYFFLTTDIVGDEAIQGFTYILEEIMYDANFGNTSFYTDISENDGIKIVGTFSGDVIWYNEDIQENVVIVMQNGEIDISY